MGQSVFRKIIATWNISRVHLFERDGGIAGLSSCDANSSIEKARPRRRVKEDTTC